MKAPPKWAQELTIKAIMHLRSLGYKAELPELKGDFPICYPEFLVRSQIAVAERLEAILDSLEVQRLDKLPTSLKRASEPNRRASRKKVE